MGRACIPTSLESILCFLFWKILGPSWSMFAAFLLSGQPYRRVSSSEGLPEG